MAPTSSRRLVFQPNSYLSLQSGAHQIIDAIAPTLGPLPRITAIDRILDERPPEQLDSGGMIAKRVIQIRNRDADVGAMFVRDFLWELEEQEGDGTATAAVLFRAVFDEGVRHVAAGLNARRLHAHLETGMRLILSDLTDMAQPLKGRDAITGMARTVCYDAALSDLLGEIFDIIGEFGRLEVRKGEGRGLHREYVEGLYWDKGVFSREMITGSPAVRVELENPAILISDLKIATPEQLLPVLACAVQNDMRRLFIVARDLSDGALAFLLANNRDRDKLQIVAVRAPGYGAEEQAWALTDLVALCGGRAFVQGAGDSLRTINPDHFGHARRAWAGFHSFGIIGGRGDPRALRRHISDMRSAYDNTTALVPRGKFQQRLGKLLGGSATLRIGAATGSELEARMELAERTANVIRGALREGILPGGGIALLHCRPALLQLAKSAAEVEERAAYTILAHALAAPARTIAANAGFDASDVLAEIRQSQNGAGFDVLRGETVDMVAAGIVDSAGVTKAAVYAAISSAALALTIDVLVHRPQQSGHAEPRSPGHRKQL